MTDQQDIELEYKFLVKDKMSLIRLLNNKSNQTGERQYQSNVMFDNPQKLMQTTNGRVRVRKLGSDGKKILTYKKHLPPENGAKREIEYEVNLDDPKDQIEKILGAIEFTPSTSYERYQTKWILGTVHVTLDEYPFGDFVEIEGKKMDIEKVSQELGFNLSNGLTRPIDTLFQEWRKAQGLGFKPQMKFDDFNK